MKKKVRVIKITTKDSVGINSKIVHEEENTIKVEICLVRSQLVYKPKASIKKGENNVDNEADEIEDFSIGIKIVKKNFGVGGEKKIIDNIVD